MGIMLPGSSRTTVCILICPKPSVLPVGSMCLVIGQAQLTHHLLREASGVPSLSKAHSGPRAGSTHSTQLTSMACDVPHCQGASLLHPTSPRAQPRGHTCNRVPFTEMNLIAVLPASGNSGLFSFWKTSACCGSCQHLCV